MNRPKFCIGEVVDVVGTYAQLGVEVLAYMYVDNATKINLEGFPERFNGYFYRLSHVPTIANPERNLRKRREDRWQDCVWKPEELSVT